MRMQSNGASADGDGSHPRSCYHDESMNTSAMSDVAGYSARRFDSFLAPEHVNYLRDAVRTARKRLGGVGEEAEGEYSSGDTFFVCAADVEHADSSSLMRVDGGTGGGTGGEASDGMDADEDAGRVLDKLAMDVFHFHTHGMTYEPTQSGAEWWCMVLNDDDDDDDDDGSDEGVEDEDSSDEEDDGEGDAIAMHWDKDYEFEEENKISLYPTLSTVTYLTDKGAPTCICEGSMGPRTLNPANESQKPFLLKYANFGRCIYSVPVVGAHISFDGRLLHGAPFGLEQPPGTSTAASVSAARSTGDEEEDGTSKRQRITAPGEDKKSATPMRITFLVNIWLNHIPTGAIRRKLYINSSSTSSSSSSSFLNPLIARENWRGADEVRPKVTILKGSSSSQRTVRFARGFGTGETDPISLPFDRSIFASHSFSSLPMRAAFHQYL